jgi:hypothetical protein
MSSRLSAIRRALARIAPPPKPDMPWLVITRGGGAKVAGRWAVVAVRLGEVLRWRTLEEAQPWLDAQRIEVPHDSRAITPPYDSEV